MMLKQRLRVESSQQRTTPGEGNGASKGGMDFTDQEWAQQRASPDCKDCAGQNSAGHLTNAGTKCDGDTQEMGISKWTSSVLYDSGGWK